MLSIKENLPLTILIFAAFLTRFLFLNYPSEVVFDEVHFGKFVSSYFTHKYYFDIHPPLGKLMIAGFARLNLARTNFGEFAKIGETIDSRILFILRFLPAFFGSLLVILIYFFILKIGLSKKAAFFGAFLVLFDNALLVQSKFILLDIFLLFFGVLALYFFVSYIKFLKPDIKHFTRLDFMYLLACGVFAALAFSIKWTGLSFLAIIILYEIFNNLKILSAKNARVCIFGAEKLKQFFIELAILILVPILVYSLIFLIHFNILYKSGPGSAFMSPTFQNLNFSQKFIELNKAMYRYNATLSATHSDGSLWYQWPFGKKPIWYWVKTTGSKTANIYFLANPLIWWLIILTVIFFSISLFIKKLRKNFPMIIYFLLLAYFLNLLAFIFIKRVTFLYHYLPSLIFGIIITAAVFDYSLSKEKFKKVYFIYLAIVFLMFIFLLPLTYGFPVSLKINQIYSLFIKFFH